MAKNKKIQPLGTVIRQKSLLNEDLRVGDMVEVALTEPRCTKASSTSCETQVLSMVHGVLTFISTSRTIHDP